MKIFSRKFIKIFLILFVILGVAYGSGRLYYHITDGFSVSNIVSDYSYDPRWETRQLSLKEKELLDSLLSKPFYYLGKGCQSYVFLSKDGNYVLKFFKYQRFRHQPWLDHVTFIPGMENYRQHKIEKKLQKREGVFKSWVIAFNELQSETELVYVHLNKGKDLERTITIFDKMGHPHEVKIDQLEFLIQKRAQMLCPYIDQLMQKNEIDKAKSLLNRIIVLILSEYKRGYADNDHALMQNTGIFEGRPIHIDVGQFVHNPESNKPEIYKQDLFSKTYKFRKWLHKKYPELASYLEIQLYEVIGPSFFHLEPHFKQHE